MLMLIRNLDVERVSEKIKNSKNIENIKWYFDNSYICNGIFGFEVSIYHHVCFFSC